MFVVDDIAVVTHFVAVVVEVGDISDPVYFIFVFAVVDDDYMGKM